MAGAQAEALHRQPFLPPGLALGAAATTTRLSLPGSSGWGRDLGGLGGPQADAAAIAQPQPHTDSPYTQDFDTRWNWGLGDLCPCPGCEHSGVG